MAKKTKPVSNAEAIEPAINQRSFLELELMEEQDQRPGLVKCHDLADFADETSARYALDACYYSATEKRIAATNGKTAIAVPVSGDGMPTAMIDAQALRQAIKDAGDSPVYVEEIDGRIHLGVPGIVVRRAAHIEGRYPDLFGLDLLQPSWCPDFTLTLSVAELAKIVKYAKANKCHAVCLGMKRPNRNGEVSNGVRFTFSGGCGEIDGAIGFVMPMAKDE